MSIGLKSDSSGTSGSIVINGSDKIVITSAGNVTAGTFTGAVVGNVTGSLTAGGSVTSGVAVTSTSGTAIDFTGIPSWVKRIAVMFNGVSTNGNNALQVKLGTSSGLESTGYVGTVCGILSTSSNAQSMGTTGFDTYSNAAAAINIGQMVITTVGSNVWIASYNISNYGATYLINVGNGNKTLSGTLDRVRITTTSGTDTFDAGSINIMYEG